MILVGNGYNTNALKTLAHEIGRDNIIFLEKLRYQDVPLILRAADVYLNTNDESNLSHPVLEAMTCGTAILSMDDGSLDGIVKNGETGLLVDPRKCSEQLPEAIKALYCNRDLLMEIGRNAAKWADESFYTWDQKNRIELDEIRDLLRVV